VRSQIGARDVVKNSKGEVVLVSTMRTYLSRVDEAGRLVIFRHDGVPITKEEQDWFAQTVTVQLRTDNMTATHQHDTVSLDQPVLSGRNRKTGEEVLVHPLIHELQALIQARGWRLAAVSRALGFRNSALSEWMRGMFRPNLANAAAAFGAAGYRLVPVSFRIEEDVRKMCVADEQEILAEYYTIGLGQAD